MDGAKLAAARLASRTHVRGRARGDGRLVRANEPWWRAARSGDWDAYYERQYGGARLRELGDRLTMRVAVTGAAGRLGRRS